MEDDTTPGRKNKTRERSPETVDNITDRLAAVEFRKRGLEVEMRKILM